MHLILASTILFVVTLGIIILAGYIIFGTLPSKNTSQTEPNYTIGKPNKVNDIEQYGNDTISVLNIGDKYLAFVLLPNEFWHSVVCEDTEKAVIFDSENKAKSVAAQLLATSGFPVILEKNETSSDIFQPINLETDEQENAERWSAVYHKSDQRV